jgi:predicted glycosyl hydrolase (DUF1957 family)
MSSRVTARLADQRFVGCTFYRELELEIDGVREHNRTGRTREAQKRILQASTIKESVDQQARTGARGKSTT